MTAKSNKNLLSVGQHYSGSGVFVGQQQFVDKNGQPLGVVFNVFTPAQKLLDDYGRPLADTYNRAVEKVSALNGFEGHDGAKGVEEEGDILTAVKREDYEKLGQWHLPSLPILKGILYNNQQKGQLSSLFSHLSDTRSDHGYGGLSRWLWSCTKVSDVKVKAFYVVGFTDKTNEGKNGFSDDCGLAKGDEHSVCPIRLELAS